MGFYTGVTHSLHPVAAMGGPARPGWEYESELAEQLCAELFESFTRRDQRETGLLYVLGLLRLPGRKTMRAIAEQFGGGALQQRLQHFISHSSWDWLPVRESLRDYAARELPAHAIVVRQVVMPKDGKHSVGVMQRVARPAGKRGGQQAYGAWLAGEDASVPVSWQLDLPQSWLTDDIRRRQVGIPESPEGCTENFPGELACRTALGTAQALPSVPVVLATSAIDPASCIRLMDFHGASVMFPVSGALPLIPEHAVAPIEERGRVPARLLAERRNGSRRPMFWQDRARALQRRSCAVAIPVRLGACPAVPLRLLAEWDQPGLVPDRLWLTNHCSASDLELLRLSKLVGRVDRDYEQIAKAVGIQDFEGRSFPGWHRHVTLVSIAHALRVRAARAVAAARVPALPNTAVLPDPRQRGAIADTAEAC